MTDRAIASIGGREAVATPNADDAGPVGLNVFASGSTSDFERLYRESFSRIVRTVMGIVGSQAAAEDCTQEAFARALPAWPRWHGEVPAEAWLHRIAVNTAISYRRREQIRALPSLLRRLGPPAGEPDPADHAGSRSVLAELRRLPPKQSAAIILRYYHGYTNREIAASLGVSERTVGQRIADGLAIVRKRVVVGE